MDIQTDDFETTFSDGDGPQEATETPEDAPRDAESLLLPPEPMPPAKKEPVPQADGDDGEDEDLGKYSSKEIHDNPRLRILKATKEAAEAKREAHEAREALDRYMRQQKPAEVTKEPQEEDFETYKEYVKAQSRWEARQEFEERTRAQQESYRKEQIARAADERVTAFQAQVQAEGEGFLDTVSQDVLNITPDTPLGHSITSSPMATKLMKHFTEHPDQFRALSSLHPALVFREIGKIEGKLEGVAVTASAPPRVSVSRAKPPVRPVAGTPNSGDEDSDSMSFEDFVKHENAKERAQTH